MSIFEAIMLICFGAAWPISIMKSYKSRSSKGKSIIFLYIIFIGYIAGILNKLLYNMDFIICLYILNSIMVSVDIMLYYRNSKFNEAN